MLVILAPLGALHRIFLTCSFTPLGREHKCCIGRDWINQCIMEQILLTEKQREIAQHSDNWECIHSSYPSGKADTWTQCLACRWYLLITRYRGCAQVISEKQGGQESLWEYGCSSPHPGALLPSTKCHLRCCNHLKCLGWHQQNLVPMIT